MTINRKIGVCAMLFGIGLGISATSFAQPQNCFNLYKRCSTLAPEYAEDCWMTYERNCT